MSQPAETAPDTKRARRRRTLIVGGAIAVCIAVALLTGFPQRLALEYGLRRALGSDVRVRGLSLVPRVRIAELRVDGEPDAAPVVLQGVDLAYALNVESGVTVSTVHVDSAKVDIRQGADGRTNFAFLDRVLHPPAREEPVGEEPFDVSPYIPKRFGIGDLSLTFESPDGAIELGGLHVEAEWESLAAMTARLHASQLRGTLRVSESGEERPLAGTMDIQFLSNMPSMGVTVKVDIPEIVTLDGKVHFVVAVGTTAAQARIDVGRFTDDEWTVLLPEKIAFDSLDVSGTEFTVSSPPGVPWDLEADVHLDGRGIRAGEPGHEWYNGDLKISGTYDGDRGAFDAELNRGQRLSVVAEGEPADALIAATLIDWDREDLVHALPKDFRALLDELPHLSQIGASAEVRVQWPRYTVNASVDPLFAPDAGTSERFALQLQGQGTADTTAEDLFHGEMDATLGGGELSATVDADTPARYTAELALAAINTARWIAPIQQRIPIAPPPGLLDGTLSLNRDSTLHVKTDLTLLPPEGGNAVTLSGTAEADTPEGFLPLSGRATLGFPSAEPPGKADIQFRFSDASDLMVESVLASVDLGTLTALAGMNALPEGTAAVLTGQANLTRTPDGVTAKLNLDAAPATLAGITIPADQPLHVEGSLTGPAAMTSLRAKKLALRLTDDAVLDVAGVEIVFTPFQFRGHVTGKIDFDYVGPVLGLPTVVGALTIDAPLQMGDDMIESQLYLEGDGFGYGKWAGPYGTPVVLNGLARYDIANRTFSIESVDAAWGEGSRLTSAQFAATLDPFTLTGPFSVTSDVAPLVDLRFLDAAEGTLTVSGTLGIGAGQTTDIEYDLAANSLTIAGAIAAFGGLSSTGAIAYGESLDGQIRFAAADAAAAGAMLHNPRGTCTIEKGVAVVKGVEASLYDGRVTFDAEVNVLDTAAGGTLEAHLEGVDLDRFTKEYEPPSVTLTGIANGDVSLAWNGDGVRDLRVDLASEKDFSLNREIIENLLLQSITAEVTGMKKLNRRIQEETIGEAAQRPFERAAVSLSLEGETYEEQRLVGPIALKSEMLNLSIDLGVDLRAIADALELQQQAQLEEGDTLSAEPVQWSLPEKSPNPQSNNSDAQSSSRAKEEQS